jgi:hypothetical protein
MIGYMAKVIEQFPTEDSVEVIFINNSPIKYRVRVTHRRANPLYGKSGGLPDIGEMGIVLKLDNYGEEYFWIGSIVDALENICAEPTGTEDGRDLTHHESDVYHQVMKNGDFEFSHPSGTFVKVGGTTLADRFRYIRKAGKVNLKEKIAYPRRQSAPVPLAIKHTWANGAMTAAPYSADKRKSNYTGDIKTTSIIMDAAGQVQIDHQAADDAHMKITLDKDGNMTIDCPHKVTVNSTDEVQVNTEFAEVNATTVHVNASDIAVSATNTLALTAALLTITNTGSGSMAITNTGSGAVDIDTGSGPVTLTSGGSLTINSSGNSTIHSSGTMGITSTGDMSIAAPNVAVST